MNEFLHRLSDYDDQTALPHQALAFQARQRPEAPALIFAGQRLSYAEMRDQVTELAAFLRAYGVGPEVKVAFALEPGPALAVAIFAILESGGVYVPLDPVAPRIRIAEQLSDSEACLFIHQDNRLAAELWPVPNFHLDQLPLERIHGVDQTRPEQAACMIYTSGSSGRPKGVVLEHRALAYYLGWYCRDLQKESGLQLPLSSSICFAASLTQFFAPFILGQPLHILERDTVRQPKELLAWYQRHPGYGLYCVPSLWQALVAAAAEEETPPAGPQGVYLTGEACTEQLLEASWRLWPRIRLWNLFGPTEATANISYTEMFSGQAVHLGRPLPGSGWQLLDEDRRPVAEGETGEIWISGPGLARGYYRRPELTAAVFQQDKDRDRIYRTGDLGRRRADGCFEYRGRRDHQVKLRGFRIELGEVELALATHPSLSAAAVQLLSARVEDSGELAAVYELKEGAPAPAPEELQDYLRQLLPDYMIPACFKLVDKLPRLSGGKLDRALLPRPDHVRPQLKTPLRAAVSELEKNVLAIWEEVLQLQGLGLDDNFLALGGNSLKAAAIIARCRRKLGLTVGYADFFACPTAAGIIAAMQAVKEAAPPRDGVLCGAKNFPSVMPAAANQRNLWFLARMNPDMVAYNIQFAIDFHGPLDEHRLGRSLLALTAAQPALRTVFAGEDESLQLRLLAPYNPLGASVDLSGLAPKDRWEAVGNTARREYGQVFDLEQGPLLRVSLLHLGNDQHCLLVTVHHLVFDGWSIALFQQELARIYGQKEFSSAEHFRDLSSIYRPAALNYASLIDFWREYLAGAPGFLELPVDRPRPVLPSYQGRNLRKIFDEDFCRRLAAFNLSHQVTGFMTLLAVFALLLYRYSRQNDMLIGCPVANRLDPAAEGEIGFFVNTIVLRLKPEDDLFFADFLGRLREQALAAFDHQQLPFDRLVEELQPKRSLSHNPLFQVMFEYHPSLPVPLKAGELEFAVREDGYESAKFDLTLEVREGKHSLDLRLNYSQDLFSAETMQAWFEQYQRLLASVLKNPARELADYGLMSREQLARILFVWNRTSRPFARGKGIHELVSEQARATPDRTALIFGQRRLNYQQLDDDSSRLALHLDHLGIGDESRIGIFMDPSPEMVIALLAVFKAGATYIPLDPVFPTERIAYMISDSGLPLIISQSRLVEQLPSHQADLLIFDQEWPRIAGLSPEKTKVAANRAPALAYIMYTSGSTGNPKGVMVPHRGVVNYLQWMRHRFPLTEHDAVLNNTTISFDISVWEIFLPLIAGARLVLAPRDVNRDPEALYRVIEEGGVTNIQFVPAALKMFVESGGLRRSAGLLRRIFSGGEALPTVLRDQVEKIFAGELHNLYGPTEASIYMCHYDCARPAPGKIVPIGRPIDNSAVYVLDRRMKPVPPGMVGELFIGGDILARGYLNRDDLTAEKFIRNPFSKKSEERIYRSGDWARYRGDGVIEFLGRVDHQIKIRGYRIELGEIRHRLLAHPDINDAVVVVQEDELDDKRTIAYLICAAELPPVTELNPFLKLALPDYMIPALYVELDKVPLLPNGKVNLKDLPPPPRTVTGDLAEISLTEDQELAAGLWRSVLASESFGLDDNFFEVGGHSLLVVRIHNFCKKHLGLEIPVVDLFQSPTVRSLAVRIREKIEYYREHGDERREFIDKMRRRLCDLQQRNQSDAN